jgi:hypothetical protein
LTTAHSPFGLTQRQIADLMAVTPDRISQIKNADLDLNQVPPLSRYAHALSARILLGESATPARNPTCGHLVAYPGLAPVTRRTG